MNMNQVDVNIEKDVNLVALVVLENGEVSWIMSESFSFDQKKVFNRVNMVLGSPSLVLRLCMSIEMILIYISLSIESLFKFKK